MKEMDCSFEIQVQHLFRPPPPGQKQLLENHIDVIVVKPRLKANHGGLVTKKISNTVQ